MFSLLTLLDDIAVTLDDVAVMTKVAVKKTSAIMSDDLAVNAGVITGTPSERELPIVKAIFIGSLYNKVYCIVGLLAIMAIYSPLVKWLLLLGGLYLCFEGAHKVFEKLFHKNEAHAHVENVSEEARIKGAVKTDLVLSAEIIILAKEALSGDFVTQTITLCVVGLAASVLIYGLVALLVKIDDLGLWMVTKNYKKSGLLLVRAMPVMMKGLGIIGTLAMFLVGGSIVAHTFHIPYHIPNMLQDLLIGLIVGLIVVGIFEIFAKVKNKFSRQAS